MYNPDTDLLFPPRVIPNLIDSRGSKWHKFVREVLASQDESIEQLSFILMMARLAGCASCCSDSFRAMQGCTTCARQSIKRYRGSDSELIKLYQQVLPEVEHFLEQKN